MDQSGSHVSLPFQDLIEQLAAQYEVSFLDPEVPACGTTNLVVLFRDSVARVHDPSQAYRSRAFVEVEVAILDALALEDFPCPRVLRCRDGSALFAWHYGEMSEMSGHGLLMTRCRGEAVDKVAPAVMGDLVGRLHAASLARPIFADPQEARRVKSAKEPVESDDIVSAGKRVAEKLRFQNEAYSALLLQLVAVASCAEDDAPVQGIVHLDLNKSNLLYDESSDELSLVDFDFAMPGPLLLDVGFALVEYCCNARGAFVADAAVEFLRAYDKRRPFARGELQRGLKKYFALVWLRTLCWLWDKPSHWSRSELLQYGKRVVPIVASVLEWDLAKNLFV